MIKRYERELCSIFLRTFSIDRFKRGRIEKIIRCDLFSEKLLCVIKEVINTNFLSIVHDTIVLFITSNNLYEL